jgi:hypothetical protein
LYVGNRDINRVGSLFLTDKRVVLVGELLSTPGQGGTCYKLCYDNWNQQPFLDAVDYVYMSQVRLISTEGDWRSHGIELTVVTKYYEDKREKLSDPNFFRTGSPSKLKAIEGPIKIVLEARKLSGAEDPKVRHEALLRRLKQHISLK